MPSTLMTNLKKVKMNQSDDDIFGRNIDQLDRETPRFNLSEEEDNNAGAAEEALKKGKTLEKKMSASSQKLPSIASVQPYSRASTQTPVLSPHPSKKNILPATNEIPQPPPPSSAATFYNQRFTTSSNNYTGPPAKLNNNFQSANQASHPNMKMARQLTETSAQIHNHAGTIPPQGITQQPPLSMESPQMCGGPICSIPQQMHCDSSNPQMNTSFINQKLNPPPPPVIRVGPPEACPCYCPDCMHTPPPNSQQLVINSERQKIEDEILIRQRELDSCWQEDELDFPRDFTAIDRKKEKFYAQRVGHDKFQRGTSDSHPHPPGWHQDETVDAAKDSLLSRETKTTVDATSAYPTTVSRKHQVATPTPAGVSMAAPVKAKAQAVVSPLPRTIAQKKVNINTVVSRFSYSNEPDNPQDYTSAGWPQSEMGSRIPSSERINLSPLCMSGVPSGIQTPVEHGTGQKQLPPSEIPSVAVPRATQLQQLPGHEKKKASILDKFKGNEQYKRSLSFPQGHTVDSVKDFTSSKWPQSEMGSRIPSSERISLSPLTMSGVASAVQSGIQTPLEPNTGAIPLKSLLKRPDTASPSKCSHKAVEKHESVDENHNTTQEVHGQQNEADTIRDFSKVPQSELTSRVPSTERICLSPLCQSGIPSGCQTPQEEGEPEAIINEDGVKLRPHKTKSINDSKLEEVMSRMNITDNSAVPRFDYVEEDSVKDFSRPEQFSRMQSYENLNFTPPWSASTSGIVTPCDLGGLYGGSKPLRDQPLIEENEEDNNNDISKERESSQNSKVEIADDLAHEGKRSPDELTRQQQPLNQPVNEIDTCIKGKQTNTPIVGTDGSRHPPVTDGGRHPPVADSSRHPPVPDGSRHSAVPDGSRHPPVADSSRHLPVPEGGRHQTISDGGRHPPVPDSSRHAPVPDSSRHPPVPDGSRHPPVPDGSRHPPGPDGSRHPPVPDGSRHPPATDGSRHPPATDSSRHPPATDVSRHPPAPDSSRHPPVTDGSRHPPVPDGNRHPPISDGGFNADQEHFHEIQKVEQQKCQAVEGMKVVDICNQGNHDMKHHSRTSQLAPPSNMKRRNSWSSVESTSSNRTDISTVVNAPTSMHNTAPGSPDPDGSEASDSDITDEENDENEPNLSDSFSQTASPHLSQKRRPNPVHQVPQQQYQSQQRWQGEQGERHLLEKQKAQQTYPDDCCNNHQGTRGAPPAEDQVKSLIKAAKEKFSNKPVQNSCSEMPNDSARSPQMHVSRYPPHQQQQKQQKQQQQQQQQQKQQQQQQAPPQQRIIQQGGGMYYQPSMDHQGGAFYDKHHSNTSGTQRYHPQHHEVQHQPNYHNYQQHQNPNYPNHQQRPYSSNDIPPMHANLGRQAPRMQSIPESQPAPVMHSHNMCLQGSTDTVQAHEHQGVPIGSMPYPLPMLNSQQVNHAPQQYYGKPMGMMPHSCAQDEERASSLFPPNPQQRAYSITSLEPNRHTPPHADALDTISVVSFASMAASNQNLDTKADMMSSLLSMLGTHDPDDMARTLLAMSSSPDSCAAMRQSGCVPLLIKLLHSQNYDNGRINWGARQRAGLALHKIVHSNDGDRRGKREMRVLRLLEIIRTHSEAILSKDDENYCANRSAPPLRDHGPGPAVAAIMKLSFEEEHKNTICELGGLQTIGEILAVDYIANKECNDPYAIALRKYAGMVLINLTFNDSKNKAVLCSMTNTLKAIIGQLSLTDEEDIIQVFAGIIRNISWRPDENTQRALQTINAVRALMTCIQNLRAEVCIRAVLSAVWNLSAHNSENKEEICRTTGSLKFLVFALNYRSPNKSLVVIENAGGILRNVSSHIAVNTEYRKILHEEGCLQTLVSQLRSTSTRVVSNACGVLWNLSARCIEDQELLWELGAVSVLKTLINSKHKSISASSASALRNLLAVKPGSSGTDTESHVSFHHRSHSLPSKVNRRTDQKYRSAGREVGKQEPDSKNRFRLNKNYRNQHGDSQTHYFDLYQEPPVRSMTQNIIGGPVGDDEKPPAYISDISPSSSFRKPLNENKLHEPNMNPNNRVHRMYGSSSSCSSFSPKDKSQFRVPYQPCNFANPIDMERIKTECEKDVMCSEKESGISEATFTTQDESNTESRITNCESRITNCESRNPILECRNMNYECEVKAYDDCKKSVCKDTVLMYVDTPKLPVKSHNLKKTKLHSSKLSMKFKKHSFKKSADSVSSSKDSVIDKSDVEKISEKKKSRDEKCRDEKRQNVWIKTKALKQKLLNRSHSSDLAFDKTMSNVSTSRKSPFEFYSMSNFPDRVSSDQCLSATDRHLRDDLMNSHRSTDIQQGSEMHHGSWSSCEGKEERIFPKNHADFLNRTHTPQAIPKQNHHTHNDITHHHDMHNQQYKYQDGGSPTDQSFYSTHSAPGQNDMQYPYQYSSVPISNSTQQIYVTSQCNSEVNNGSLHGAQSCDVTSESEKKNSKLKKSSILKNPLKKSSDSSKPKGKGGKKLKKKVDEQ